MHTLFKYISLGGLVCPQTPESYTFVLFIVTAQFSPGKAGNRLGSRRLGLCDCALTSRREETQSETACCLFLISVICDFTLFAIFILSQNTFIK